MANITKLDGYNSLGQTDVLILRMLIDYMADGLIGPFQVMPVEPTTVQKITGSKSKTYIITGPDYKNRLRLEFNERNIANDICFALNRAYGFEVLEGWTAQPINDEDK